MPNPFHQMAQAWPIQSKMSSFDPSWAAELLGHHAKGQLESGTLSKVTSSCARGSCSLFLREVLEVTKITAIDKNTKPHLFCFFLGGSRKMLSA